MIESDSDQIESLFATRRNERLTMQTHEASLFELLEEARIKLRELNNGNNVVSTVSNVSFGPDGGGMPVISVQGEFVERLQDAMKGKNVMVSPLSEYHYNRLLESQGQGQNQNGHVAQVV